MSRLAEIGDYIADKDPTAAVRLVDSIFDATALLSDHPWMAPSLFSGAEGPIRRFVVGRYLVIYRVQPGELLLWVLTVRHAREAPVESDDPVLAPDK